jgi:hypothetical protein
MNVADVYMERKGQIEEAYDGLFSPSSARE